MEDISEDDVLVHVRGVGQLQASVGCGYECGSVLRNRVLYH